jgi:hypothetical protein
MSEQETPPPAAQVVSPIEVIAPKEPPPPKFSDWLKTIGTQLENKIQNIFRVFVGFIFRPIKLEYERQFYWIGLILVFLAFISLIFLASPWAIKNVTENVLSVENRNYLSENKDWLKTWLGFISFIFEVCIAFSIGGILFTEPVVASLKKTLEDVQKYQAGRLADSIPQGEQALIEIGNEIISLFQYASRNYALSAQDFQLLHTSARW